MDRVAPAVPGDPVAVGRRICVRPPAGRRTGRRRVRRRRPGRRRDENPAKRAASAEPHAGESTPTITPPTIDDAERVAEDAAAANGGRVEEDDPGQAGLVEESDPDDSPLQGRGGGAVIPERLLTPAVALAVAVILFEGGLSLRFRELREIGSAALGLCTAGAAVTGVLASVAAKLLVFDTWGLAILAGSIFTVTGPTVIIPLLRQIRPNGRVGAVAKWEGIVIDPVGALLAVLTFEAIVLGPGAATIVIPLTIAKVVLIGGLRRRRRWAGRCRSSSSGTGCRIICRTPSPSAAVLLGFAATNVRAERKRAGDGHRDGRVAGEPGAVQYRAAGRVQGEPRRSVDLRAVRGAGRTVGAAEHLGSGLGGGGVHRLSGARRAAGGGVSGHAVQPAERPRRRRSWRGWPPAGSWRRRSRACSHWNCGTTRRRPCDGAAAAATSAADLAAWEELLEDSERLVPLTFLVISATVALYGLTAAPWPGGWAGGGESAGGAVFGRLAGGAGDRGGTSGEGVRRADDRLQPPQRLRRPAGRRSRRCTATCCRSR